MEFGQFSYIDQNNINKLKYSSPIVQFSYKSQPPHAFLIFVVSNSTRPTLTGNERWKHTLYVT